MKKVLKKPVVQDCTTVNLREEFEVFYYARKFNVTAEKLIHAVSTMGSACLTIIEKYLQATKWYK